MNARPPIRLLISYSQQNEAICTRLTINLAPVLRGVVADLQTAGPTEKIESAMALADVVLFLLDEYYLRSVFCSDPKTPALLRRALDAGTQILFVLAADCRWKDFDYIEPLNTHPISHYTPHALAYTHIAERIAKAIADRPQDAPFALQAPVRAALAGRDEDIAGITRLLHQKGIYMLTGDGGIGKSALIQDCLSHCEGRFIFHRFSPKESSRPFLLHSLEALGIEHDIRTSDEELGRLLARHAASLLLVLEDFESMQSADGTISDRGASSLLEELAQTPGLCIVTSCRPIPDAAQSFGGNFHQQALGPLAPDAARTLLRMQGMRGEDAELGKMAKRCNRHPLSLVLAAEFCHTYLQDNAAAYLKHDPHSNREKAHAGAITAWFDGKLADEHMALDRELLRIAGLLERPLPWGALQALRRAKPIGALTLALHAASDLCIAQALARLVQWRLLRCDLAQDAPDISAHPAISAHFCDQLKKEALKAMQCAHAVLFDWFCSQPRSWQPDTLDELEPLYRAVFHGCAAKRYLSAYETYIERIQRGTEHYAQNRLGAYSCDLNALAEFFPQGWSLPPVAIAAGMQREHLSEAHRSRLISDAAYALKSMGMLTDALGAQRIDYARTREAGDWSNFCRSCENLVSLLTPLGRWVEAEAVSREAVGFAGRIADEEDRWQRMTTALSSLGHTLHGRGYLAQASTAYELAEMVQAQAHHHPKLYSVYGYNYAQLLLEQASCESDWRYVLERKHSSLDIAVKLDHPLSEALDHSAIGLASAALGEPDSVRALDLAVTTMQRAGTTIHLPAMHIARARYLRSLQDFSGAWADTHLATTIARRGNMRAYLAECALLAANLCLDEGRAEDAACHCAIADRLIVEDGYGRRLAELHLLHARLRFAQRDAAAVSALAEARARICAAGQWYFWRELRSVAAEIGAPDPGDPPAGNSPIVSSQDIR